MSAMESRLAAAKKHKKKGTGPYQPLAGQPIVLRFDAARWAACQIVGVPYGEVQVDGLPDHVHSHEVNLGEGGTSVFLDARTCREEREQRQARRQAVREHYSGSEFSIGAR